MAKKATKKAPPKASKSKTKKPVRVVARANKKSTDKPREAAPKSDAQLAYNKRAGLTPEGIQIAHADGSPTDAFVKSEDEKALRSAMQAEALGADVPEHLLTLPSLKEPAVVHPLSADLDRTQTLRDTANTLDPTTQRLREALADADIQLRSITEIADKTLVAINESLTDEGQHFKAYEDIPVAVRELVGVLVSLTAADVVPLDASPLRPVGVFTAAEVRVFERHPRPWRMQEVDTPYDAGIEDANGVEIDGLKVWLDDAATENNNQRVQNHEMIVAAVNTYGAIVTPVVDAFGGEMKALYEKVVKERDALVSQLARAEKEREIALQTSKVAREQADASLREMKRAHQSADDALKEAHEARAARDEAEPLARAFVAMVQDKAAALDLTEAHPDTQAAAEAGFAALTLTEEPSPTDRALFLTTFDVAMNTGKIEVYNVSVEKLRDLLAKNQNGPEHGADGSFTNEQWTKAKDTLDALVKMRTGA